MNQTIDLDGDTAHVETYFLIALRRKDGPVDLVGGRWDRVERRDKIWANAGRIVVVDWNSAVPKAEAAMQPDLCIHGTWDKTDVSYQRPLAVTRNHRNISF